jgi:hypothetical protein
MPLINKHSKFIKEKFVKNKSLNNLRNSIACCISLLILSTSTPVRAQNTFGNFFKGVLDAVVCGPGGKMCDQTYNPDAKNAMIENPEQVMKFIDAAGAYLSGQRDQPVGERNKTFAANKSTIAVTAKPPISLQPPLDNEAFQKLMKSNVGLASAIQGYLQKQATSIALLKTYSDGGDPWAQMFYGLAYGDDWTGIANSAESCRWIRESASAGVSSARYFIAKKAYVRADCFSETPTLEQAKIWAELALMSNDASIKQDSRELINKILAEQIAGSK